MEKSSIIILTAAAFSAAIGQLLFRVGADGKVVFLDYINAPIIAGLCFYGLGTVGWIYALSHEYLVNVYAFTALTFVLVYIGGVVLLKESIDLERGIGIVFVLAGLFLITRTTNT